ncbi:glutaminyl-tRNA synthetase [Dethiosulfatarculus sandiegensis]|uniref:Glutamate--tRNA ligase n=1 Tax=Dethiosulfatarculus sandiegensis TaxID=1429043 RepID=A0A0D2HXP0_9BACT|nr:glutaminyl-tRNA synthetase [Dethiosulfatarculus sandiegensis]
MRTRFPPSPTGALHLGGARTALFNWLFARNLGGELVFRLEDTDRKRSKEEYTQSIIQAMDWLGMSYDDGPYYQTKRFDRYRQAIDQLLAEGKAYWCHCTPEEVDAKREQAKKEGKKPMYDSTCREKNLGPAPGAVVRFKSPKSGQTVFKDLVKGVISWDNKELDDLVILRSDGTPTYHLAVVVDDIDMKVSHVIRGDDHVANTPRQILLFEALGAPLPQFGHVPMILGPDKTRLSKRHGATSVMEYKTQGFLPEAMVNMLARLGWSHGDQEIFSVEELIKYFGLEHVGKSAAVFDMDKLIHINAHYIQNSDDAYLIELVQPFLADLGIEMDEAKNRILAMALPHLKPRAKTLVELADAASPYLVDMPEMDAKAAKKFMKAQNAPILEKVRELVVTHGANNMEAMEHAFHELAEEMELKLGKVAQPTRVALTGRTFSPGIFEVMDILGQDSTLKRLDRALELCNQA